MTIKPSPFYLIYTLILSVSIQAADEIFCEDYARELINIPTDSKSTQKLCQKDQPHWNEDKAVHMKWCLGVDEKTANKKRYNHNNLVNLCNDSYKLIMIDRKRVASLAISDDEEMQMDIAPDALKKAILAGTLKSPYTRLFPGLSTALKEGKLDKCSFFSLSVDLDNNPTTKEWVVSTDKACLESEEPQKPHIWLIQQLNDDYKILFEGEDDTLNIHFTDSHNYKNISISTALKTEEETENRCGSIQAEWHYTAGRYIPFKGVARIGGICLPEYNLPDSLQGENTYELAEGEWEKAMEEEEKRRIAIFSPYKQALEKYIPEWIKRVESEIPAEAAAIAKASSATKPNKTVKPSASTTLDHPPVAADSDKKQPKPKKGLLESIREFLGLDNK